MGTHLYSLKSNLQKDMAVHLNRVLPNAHFRKRKTWAKLAKTWFNQPAKKVARRSARAAKAAAVAPRPVAGSLRAVVQCPTFRYNAKARIGRGFTFEELKGAGLSATEAKQIGREPPAKRPAIEGVQRQARDLEEGRLLRRRAEHRAKDHGPRRSSRQGRERQDHRGHEEGLRLPGLPHGPR